MKAVVLDRYGKIDGVRAGEVPDPELRDDDVLVQIHAASVNPLDLKILEGSSKLFCRTAYRSSWVTTWPVSSFESAPRCADSSPATRYTRDPGKIGSACSRNLFP